MLACSLALMVSVERDKERRVRDIHLHAGGQGFWVARMAARLGAEVTVVCALGGEPGVALEALVRAEGLGAPRGGVGLTQRRLDLRRRGG